MVGKKRLSMTLVIQMFMLLAGILMVMFCGAKQINKTNVFNAGMVAIVSVYGVAWMSDTMFSNHLPDLKAALEQELGEYVSTSRSWTSCATSGSSSSSARPRLTSP